MVSNGLCSHVLQSKVPRELRQGFQFLALYCLPWWFPDAGDKDSEIFGMLPKNEKDQRKHWGYFFILFLKRQDFFSLRSPSFTIPLLSQIHMHALLSLCPLSFSVFLYVNSSVTQPSKRKQCRFLFSPLASSAHLAVTQWMCKNGQKTPARTSEQAHHQESFSSDGKASEGCEFKFALAWLSEVCRTLQSFSKHLNHWNQGRGARLGEQEALSSAKTESREDQGNANYEKSPPGR